MSSLNIIVLKVTKHIYPMGDFTQDVIGKQKFNLVKYKFGL